MAQWLDTVCYSFDYAILEFVHSFTVATGGFFDWIMYLFGFLGEGGFIFILLGLLLFCFKKTRRSGLCVLGALLCGAIITNIILKNAIARPRPFADETRAFYDWWQYIGAPHASQNSFPSGHTTAAMAAMTAIFLTNNKKYSWTAFIIALIMGLSRMHLMVHYPTDVVGGLVAGLVGGLLGYFLIKGLLALSDRHPSSPVSRFLAGFDLGASIWRLLDKVPSPEQGKSQATSPATEQDNAPLNEGGTDTGDDRPTN